MFGADIALFYAQDGTYLLENRMATAYEVKPELSPTQPLKLIYGSQSGGNTSFIFSRALRASCLAEQSDVVVDGTGQNVIYAFGSSNTFGQHSASNRGSSVVDFSPSQLSVPYTPPSDALTTSIVSPAFTVPTDGTNYCYRYSALTQPPHTAK
jgi:hypothetical protein